VRFVELRFVYLTGGFWNRVVALAEPELSAGSLNWAPSHRRSRSEGLLS
jgi:hypothetical protein